MKQNVYRRIRFLSALALAAGSFTAIAFAQDYDINNLPDPDRPMFAVLLNERAAAGATVLPTWNGSFVFNGITYTFNMVGTDPSTTNTATTVQAVIIPVKIVIAGRRGGSQTFDPLSIPANTGGLSALQNTVVSPIFDSTTTYIQGGTNVGTTQYIDAFQRANFWGSVKTNTGYHLLLGGPTVLPEVTLNPPARQGKTGAPFGETVAEVNINWIDGQFHSLITSLGIQPNQLPIFMTYKTYLTSGGCCIGGYHSAVGGQSYAHFTYIDQPGLFSQDVSALSHEIGEWADDPLVVNANGNQTACGILEVGDPIETEANFGGFPYVLHGFTYNLQDLVTLPYFGAPSSTSVNNFFSFQGQTFTVCQNGA
jgi:hypothetical protein